MGLTVIIKWLTGHGILVLLALKTAAVPTPTSLGVKTDSSNVTPTPDYSTVNSVDVDQSEIINSTAEIPFSRLALNATETSIIISERTGKAIEFQRDSQLTPDHNHFVTVSSKASSTEDSHNNAPSEMNSKFSTEEEERFIKHIGGDDSPPMPSEAPTALQRSTLKPKPVEYQDSGFFIAPQSTKKPVDERDKMIKNIFGGECTFKVWNHCSRIRFWGGDYLVPDRNNPEKMIVKHKKIRCVENPSSNICLKNGWTVSRCHMLCMSQCNVEYRLNYDDVVLHEGECRLPIL